MEMASTKNHVRSVELAIEAAGSLRALANKLGVSHSAIWKWKEVPAKHVVKIEKVTGVPREKLRPDLYRK